MHGCARYVGWRSSQHPLHQNVHPLLHLSPELLELRPIKHICVDKALGCDFDRVTLFSSLAIWNGAVMFDIPVVVSPKARNAALDQGRTSPRSLSMALRIVSRTAIKSVPSMVTPRMPYPEAR